MAKFLIRSIGLPPAVLARLKGEENEHADMVWQQIDASEHRLRGRVLALWHWLSDALDICPAAQWVSKADDDVYIVVPDWEAQLRLLHSLGRRRVVHGNLAWSTWNTRQFMHHTWFPLCKPLSCQPNSQEKMPFPRFCPDSQTPTLADSKLARTEWRRAADYFAGDQSRANTPWLRKAMTRCKPGGVLRGCSFCPTVAECSGPFPYPTGWLFSLSRELAKDLSALREVSADIRRAMQVNRTLWGPPMLEDVWLGSLLHRFLGQAPLTFAAMGQDFYFNGGWHTGKGMEFNTTIVYHNKHELPLIQRHVELSHSAGKPILQCSGPQEAESLLPVVRHEKNAFQLYFTDHHFEEHEWCSLLDVRNLGPRKRFHDRRARVNLEARELTPEERRLVDDHRKRSVQAHAWFREHGSVIAFDDGV